MLYTNILINFVLSVISTYLLVIFIDKKYKITKSLVSSIFILFYSLEAISILTIMSDINYSFMSNLFDLTNYQAAFTVYGKYSTIGFLIVILIVFLLIYLNKKIKINNKKLKYIIVIGSIFYLLSEYSLPRRFINVCYNMNNNTEYKKSYEEIFKELNNIEYVNRADLKVHIKDNTKKNLVFIIMESYEQKLLENNYKNISKDIIKYSKLGEFFSDIKMIEGSGWTIAGIHTMMCGSPMIYDISRGILFKTSRTSNMLCFPDVLNNVDYYQVYIGGEKRTFSGKYHFLKMHGYDEIYGEHELLREYKYINKNDLTNWGVKDFDIFKIAKEKYIELSKTNIPFNLTISTLGNHFPNGIEDHRCRNTNNNGMINAIECTNDLIADFISFLEKQDNYKDTIIVLIPDHLMMNSTISNTLNKSDKRKLYAILLNTGKIKQYKGNALYVDIPDIVLNRLNIEHNAKFLLSNYHNMKNEDRIKFINNNIEKIRSFNNKTIMK